MKQLTIIAKIKAKQEFTDIIKTEAQKLVASTQKEDGCISYNFYQDNENASIFYAIENWESAESLEKHLASPHIKAFNKATENATEHFEINKLTQI